MKLAAPPQAVHLDSCAVTGPCCGLVGLSIELGSAALTGGWGAGVVTVGDSHLSMVSG